MKKSVSETSGVQAWSFDGISNRIRNVLYNAGKIKCILFLPVLFFYAQGFTQNPQAAGKIDPVFKSVLAAGKNGKDNLVRQSLSAHFKVDPIKGTASGTIIPEERYNCIIYTKNPQALRDSGIIVNSVLPAFVTAQVTLNQLAKLAAMPEVSYIKAPQMIGVNNDVAVGNTGASLLHAGRLNNTVYKGKNVLIAIFDTGIDWDHPDFRDPADPTKSRILRMWDQTLMPVGAEASPPNPYNYGVEYTQAQINDELDGTPANFVREKDIYGHGTHVAGTAAGNGSALASKKYTGMAPEADLIIIKGGDSTFPTNRIIDAITYLQQLATTLGKPIVLNMSLGSTLTGHDGTDPEEIAVDNFTASAPGRVVVAAAGNDNGFNLHKRLSLPGNSGISTIFNVRTIRSSTVNIIAYQMFINGSNDISATVTTPAGNTVTVNANQDTMVNVLNNDFTITLHNAINPGNNNRFVYFSVTRNGSNTSTPAGNWLLSVANNTSGSLISDGWMSKTAISDTVILMEADNNYTVETPGNASSAITVASYVNKLSVYTATGGTGRNQLERQDSISTSSSRGPRRDGVLKPDITAPGLGIVSSLSSDAIPATLGVVTNTGLYQQLDGTSMSTAVVSGAVALLLQSNPAATAVQIKTILASTANKDALTELPGATPNTTWGSGRADVFKAAASLFNCSPATRKTYQYDSSIRVTQYSAYYPATTQRIAVRFTPDINGKLGGVLFYTIPFTTRMFLEVRSNNAGRPGTLLGTLNLDSLSILKTSMNYVDLSSLNISITSAADYFIVMGRSAGSNANWGLSEENVALDSRSLISVDGGVNWTIHNYDLVIRSVVYNNGQLSGTIATANAVDTRDINTSNSFLNNCALINQLVPSGASPVTGTVTSNVWLEPGVPHYGNDPYVSRHYQITPSSNASGATGRITLYFTQQEFTAFNSDPYSVLDLPANPADAMGKANLRIGKYPGSSSDNTGLPATYGGTPVVIDPDDADIIWNTEYNRWEVSFTVNGFSGFVVQTKASTLPLFIEYFNGKKDRTGNQLTWKVTCINASAVFEVQRSSDGLDFDSIGHLFTTQASCALPANFTDAAALPGNNFYRIKITESNGTVRYTGVVLLKGDAPGNTVYPTLLTRNTTVQVNYTGVKGYFIVTDATGRQLYNHILLGGAQSLALPLHANGIYYYSIKNDEGKISGGKLVVK